MPATYNIKTAACVTARSQHRVWELDKLLKAYKQVKVKPLFIKLFDGAPAISVQIIVVAMGRVCLGNISEPNRQANKLPFY